MGDTPEREKGVYPWKRLKNSRRKAKGKKVDMGSGMDWSSNFVV